jgi:hypothetical protein
MKVQRARASVVAAELATPASLFNQDELLASPLLRHLRGPALQAAVTTIVGASAEGRSAMTRAFQLEAIRPVWGNFVVLPVSQRAQPMTPQPIPGGRRLDVERFGNRPDRSARNDQRL